MLQTFLRLIIIVPLLTTTISVKGQDSIAYTFFIPSAIKTIAGQQPDTELFDLTFNLNAGQSRNVSRVNFFGSIDLALSEAESDSTNSKSDKVVDAGIAVNVDFGHDLNNKELRIYVGPELKIFNTNTYYGLHLGGMLVGNYFYSSFFNLGYIRPLNKTLPSENLLTQYKNNLLAEFAFTSDDAPVLKNIRVKGGVIFPIDKNASDNDVTARIVIQVPIGGIYRFGYVKKSY
ncbi:MAG: hypothetical protein RJQ09_14595 [Cyclobacteriaceae bacterium]